MPGQALNLTTELPVSEITLHRGDTGLGFNIRGGVDLPNFKEDTGIFVTRLKEAGAAYRDRRLKEGDKIIEVNGTSLHALTHNEAVQVFITAGEVVTMKVQHGAEAHVLKILEGRKKGNKGLLIAVLVIGIAAAAGVGFFLSQKK